MSQTIFVGTQTKPSFMVEILKNKISIYEPDKYSKSEDFYEKYSLGKQIMNTTFKNVIFTKETPIVYKKIQKEFNIKSKIVSELILKTNDYCFLINKKITKLKCI